MRWSWILLALASCYDASTLGDDDDEPPIDAPAPLDTAVDTPAVVCPPGFESFGGTTVYEIQAVAVLGWKAGEAACAMQGDGIHLAVIDDKLEADQIAMHLQASRRYWVGMVQPTGQAQKKDGWVWVTGGPGIDYWAMNANQNEPTDGDNPNGTIVTAENDSDQFASMRSDGTLDDDKQTTNLAWICECDHVKVDTTIAIP